MTQSLNISTKQSLLLTHKLQKAIQLIKLSAVDLTQEIQNQVDSNPMLEAQQPTEDPLEIPVSAQGTFRDHQWTPTYSNSDRNTLFHQEDLDYLTASHLSLQDYLTWQLNLSPITDLDKLIATVLVDAINDDGYLTCSLMDICLNLTQMGFAVTVEEINAVAHKIQHMDPIGCCSVSLKESLLIQLAQLPSSTPNVTLCKKIIHEHINLVASCHHTKLKQTYQIDQETLEKIMQVIYHLHPKPGNLINSVKPDYIRPDLIVQKINNRWQVDHSTNLLPRLSINAYYASLIKTSKNEQEGKFLKNNLKEARWFLKTVETRQETLLKVARYIVDYQKEFLDFGEKAMKPLILNDVADAIGMNESTISRVTTQKYISTPQGCFELNYFFSSRMPLANGGESSSTAIKSLIRKLINAEDHQKPLSDDSLAELMNKEGIKIARRTVTNYRKSMLIAPSPERKH